MSPCAQPNLVPCPRAIPTCLVVSDVLDSIGNTPLIRLQRASDETGCNIFAKAEFLNPGGSIKDRIARHIILEAEKRGDLKPGSTIMEVTSGNTGISLSMVGAMRGYKVVIIMPRTVSEERRHMIASFGAELELLTEINDIQEAVRKTEEVAAARDDIFLPRQFANPDNIEAHRTSTGPEILQQLGHDLDAFVMGVGTGGTVTGVGRALREADSNASVVGLDRDDAGTRPDHCHGTLRSRRALPESRFLSAAIRGIIPRQSTSQALAAVRAFNQDHDGP